MGKVNPQSSPNDTKLIYFKLVHIKKLYKIVSQTKLGKITKEDKDKKIKKNNDKENKLIPLIFQNRSIIGYLKTIAQLIIVVDL